MLRFSPYPLALYHIRKMSQKRVGEKKDSSWICFYELAEVYVKVTYWDRLAFWFNIDDQIKKHIVIV